MKIIPLIGGLCLAAIVTWAGPNEKGFYIGAGIGASGYADDDFVEEWTGSDDLETSDSGYVVYGGYQFNKIVGVELSYKDYGEFTSANYDQAFTAYNVAANAGYSFLDGQLRPFALAGLGYLSVDINNRVPYLTDKNDNAVSVEFGFGIQYEPNALGGLGFRIAYDANVFSRTVEMAGEDDETYSQAVGLFYGALQYKF